MSHDYLDGYRDGVTAGRLQVITFAVAAAAIIGFGVWIVRL